MLNLRFRMTDVSFDSRAVVTATDKAAKGPIVKSLQAVRRHMLASLQRGNGTSQPGQPPRVHTSSTTKTLRNIMLDYDEQTKTGVVGSVGINGEVGRGLPGMLEAGGVRRVKTKGRGGRAKVRRIRVAPRPYAGPALQKAKASNEIMSPWSNVVTG